MTLENRERVNQCRDHLSDAIIHLVRITKFISSYQYDAAPPSSYFMCSVLREIHSFCQKINEALQYDTPNRPIISTAPIFAYFMVQITRFNQIMGTITSVVASLQNRTFIWTLTHYEGMLGTQPAPKLGSAYFKEIQLIEDQTIHDDAPGCECTICFDSLSATNTIITNCHHSFCGTCIKGYANANKEKTKKPNCPMCRTDLTEFIVGNREVHNEIRDHIMNL